MNKTPRTRIENLLKIHGGHCFIVKDCDDFASLVTAALEMQSEGLVTVSHGAAGQVQGTDVKKKGYRAKPAAPDEIEPPTH